MTATRPRTATDEHEGDVDPRNPYLRLRALLDADSFDGAPAADAERTQEPCGAVVADGRVHGLPVVAFCTDAALMGGSLGRDGCLRIAAAIDRAADAGIPVIGIWHSGGARLGEGVAALEGQGAIFAATVRASGRIPQLSVVVGPAAGGAAYGPALTDVIVMSDAGRIFVTGPAVVRDAVDEDVDMETLGGPDAHGPRSGVVHVVAASEAAAYERTRDITRLLADQREVTLERVGPPRDIRALLPDSPVRAYDVHPVVAAVLDEDPGFVELQPTWAANVVIGLGRLAGRTVGVVANNPLRKAGCLDSLSAEKAARFVQMCDSLAVPLVVLVDVPGYLPGVDQEWGGVVRRGAKLLHAFSRSVVPRVTVVMRKSFGGAYIAMNSRALGATSVFVWPEAEVSVMGAAAAVGVLHRRALAAADESSVPALRDRLVAQHLREVAGLHRGIEVGAFDEIIDPAQTRARVAAAIAAAPRRRGRHTNSPL